MEEEKLLKRMSRLISDDNRAAMMESLWRTRTSFLSQLSPKMLLAEETLLQAKKEAEEDKIATAVRLVSEGIAVDRFVQLLLRFADEITNAVTREQNLLTLAEEVSRDSEVAREFTHSIIENRHESVRALAERLELDEELLRFVAETPLAPLFREIASVYVVKEMNLKACPVCARKFSVGFYSVRPPSGWDRFSGMRRRYMICLLCGTSVPTSEIWCPRCGPSETEKVAFIQLQDEPHLGIDYCPKCKTYVKTVDTDVVGKPSDPLLLDYATFDLDGIAKQQGLRSALTD